MWFADTCFVYPVPFKCVTIFHFLGVLIFLVEMAPTFLTPGNYLVLFAIKEVVIKLPGFLLEKK